MPELPEMEAWRRQLDGPVSAFPIAKAGPAHIATLKTYDPPLATLDGRRFSGARAARQADAVPDRRRRARPDGAPDERGAAALRAARATRRRRRPRCGCASTDGGELLLTEGGPKKRAGVWLYRPEQLEEELAHLGPEALGLGADRLGEILRADRRQLHPLLRDQRAIAGIGRAWANEILHTARLSPFKLSTDLDRRGGRAARRVASTTSSRAGSSCASAARRTTRSTASTTASASRATSAASRSGASTTRSTRSTTARRARPAGRC